MVISILGFVVKERYTAQYQGFFLHVFLMLFLFQDAFSGLFSNWFPVRISEHVRSSQPFLGPNLVPPRCPTLV